MAFFWMGPENDPFSNLALEASFCRLAAKIGQPILYLWQNVPCVVIGCSQNPWLECDLAAMDADGVLLVRRRTGGGAVYHDGGNLNYSFCLPEGMFSEERQYGVILDALRSLGIRAERTGRNDLVAGGKKLSGSAFLHSNGAALQHGTLLVESDLSVFGRYLTPEREKFAAKGVKSVSSRVANLTEFAPELTIERLCTAIIDAFSAEYGLTESAVLPDSEELERETAEFRAWEFRYGKTPRFDRACSRRFAFGGIKLLFTITNGVVTECGVNSDLLDTEFPAALAATLTGVRFLPQELAEAAQRVCTGAYTEVASWLATIE